MTKEILQRVNGQVRVNAKIFITLLAVVIAFIGGVMADRVGMAEVDAQTEARLSRCEYDIQGTVKTPEFREFKDSVHQQLQALKEQVGRLADTLENRRRRGN